ncbi:flagellar hook-associated protein FlgL [Paenibacillus sp. FSL H7-0331]|jgi:flagellar hook-associated protein 3 FlgL|uniref:flagellar hook-associated protein FlgL n=1 Tax=Paenibacillus sp. FSL H7-0331 TaxID=1920421 RepID=UPI00096E83DC|nr:flagellar hook-associated protein FlgL [Paenibacillus sp. FSL H7-0331]OMF13108.1 flagellar biosynthesis protein FlgL [Paenibacillus sp. FSL H7-0331]
MQRVTQGMMSTQFLRNLNNNLKGMDNMQNQLATGRRLNKPSDDPVGISFSMRYRSELSTNEQFQSNTNSATSWMSFTDTVMGQAGEVIQKLREMAVKASNGTNPQAALDTMKAESSQLYEQIVDIGNSQFNGKYVFNGELTNLKPYTLENAVTEQADTGMIDFEIGAGVKIPVNVPGNRVFGELTDTDNMFKITQDFVTALGAGDFTAINKAIGDFDSRMNKFLDVRADIGAKMNRIELTDERLKDISLNVESLQSKTEDADMAGVITNLKVAENIYQASLSTGAKIIQPSLMDFLR